MPDCKVVLLQEASLVDGESVVKKDREAKKKKSTVARHTHNRSNRRSSRRYNDSENESSDSSKSLTPNHRYRRDLQKGEIRLSEEDLEPELAYAEGRTRL